MFARYLVLQVEHKLFENRAQAARACVKLERLLRNRPRCVVSEFEVDALELEQLLVLLQRGVLRLLEYLHERVLAR